MTIRIRPEDIEYAEIDFALVEEIRRAEDEFFLRQARGITAIEDRTIIRPTEPNYLDTVLRERGIILGQEDNIVKTVNITAAGAIIENSRTNIPELAKVSLDKYSNNKVKELKLVTKAFKSKFPFYSQLHQRRSFSKIFEILKKGIDRNIPYITEAKVPYIEIPSNTTGAIIVRLGPYMTPTSVLLEMRYLRYLTHLARKYSLPFSLAPRITQYTKPPVGAGGSSRYAFYTVEAERHKNTYEVLELKITFSNGIGQHGYLILFYLEYILKALETLHRKAHYVETTYRVTDPTTAPIR